MNPVSAAIALPTDAFGASHLWAQADWVIQTVAVLLFLMSVLSWTVIALCVLRQFRARGARQAAENFWDAPDYASALTTLQARAPDSSFTALATQGAHAAARLRQPAGVTSLGGAIDPHEFLTRALRQSLAAATARLESGLTLLASIGSTAPFIGLFGTVWGIYHALIQISASGAATIDKVAGPVGESLIMTAFGLFVAIPAVLAYNAITRANRLELASLDAFAHDLLDYLTTGARLAPAPRARA
ncbi:MAG: MotA/TolQ/ExbB proton channel family protein [Rhodocyclaceae bacterium]|nr:MotA/TolQ/ExbB proton channel family protein [Rhodocyclaceae bacterium]